MHWKFARSATENRGAGHRTFRNMVVYLAADADRMAELDAAVRDYLAWTAVLSSVDLDLTQNQRSQAKERHRLADQTVESRLLLTYQWALVPEQPDPARPCTIAESRIEGSAPALAERVSRRLGSDAQLNTTQAAAAIRIAIGQIPTVWERGHVSVGALWQLFASYPYLPRLRDQEVLNRGVRDQPLLWQQEGFALADGFDGERYGGLTAGHGELTIQVTNGTLLVRPDVAQRQLDADGESPDARGAASGPMSRELFVEVEDGVHVRTHRTTRFTGSTTLGRDRCAAEFGKVAEEVIAHLVTDDARLTVRVEIEADSPTGFDEAIVRAVSENAATLRFDRADFERQD